MSTIVSSFVKDRASAAQLPTASLISGAAKVWVNFDSVPATPVILGSFNVSSLQDNGAGLINPQFASPMANAVYASNVTAFVTGLIRIGRAAHATTYMATVVSDTAGAFLDARTSATAFGDLA